MSVPAPSPRCPRPCVSCLRPPPCTLPCLPFPLFVTGCAGGGSGSWKCGACSWYLGTYCPLPHLCVQVSFLTDLLSEAPHHSVPSPFLIFLMAVFKSPKSLCSFVPGRRHWPPCSPQYSQHLVWCPGHIVRKYLFSWMNGVWGGIWFLEYGFTETQEPKILLWHRMLYT